MKQFDTPILFLIFNRPDTTRKVFDKIREVKPRFLYVAADGPRKEKEGEAELCANARAIINRVDWDCKVITRFQEQNLGCGLHVSGAITWFFEQVEEGIILEDDCLPNKNFFKFCEENLIKYRNVNNIKSISGTCLIENFRKRETYYFSKYPLIWGWATWKRAWNQYVYKWDYEKVNYEEIFSEFGNDEKKFWEEVLHKIVKSEIDTWDYQWLFSVWLNKGFSIQPYRNFITNIGFGESATHTRVDNLGIGNRSSYCIPFKIVHPNRILINKKNDRKYFKKFFNYVESKSLQFDLISKLKKIIIDKLVKILSYYFSPIQNKHFNLENNPFGINFEGESYIESALNITNGNKILLDENSSVGKFAWIEVVSHYFSQEFHSGSIKIGRNTRIGNFSCITAISLVSIGDGVLISDHFYASDHSHNYNPDLGSPVCQDLTVPKPVIVGNNCFIGMRVSLLPGVILGDNCVVGAHSVVNKSFPPYSMIAGVPARLIKVYNKNLKVWELV